MRTSCVMGGLTLNIPRWVLMGLALLAVSLALEWVFKWLVVIFIGAAILTFLIWALATQVEPKGLRLWRKERK